jgi:hypothetical protein
LRDAIVVAHLTLAATWLGAMVYSLLVVQPRVGRFFTDERRREAFLVVLANGNRWRVAPLAGALLLTAAAVVGTAPRLARGYAAALVLYAVAAAIFANVSWRHWPARVFALPDELAGFQRRLRAQAWAMVGLVGTAFVVALSASVAAAS